MVKRIRRSSKANYDSPFSKHTEIQQGNILRVEQFQQHRQPRQKIRLIPKNLAQETYVDALEDPSINIVFAMGYAGSGKTYLATLFAIQQLRQGVVQKIVITRPNIAVDDKDIGFLPGDIMKKMAPWTRPIFDIIGEYYKQSDIVKMLDDQIIEISPLAYMRGRTFKNSWIIADEMQNATPSQMKMLLTRLGEGSKMIITGDTRQADRKEDDNGLLDFIRLVDEYCECKFVSGVEFVNKDIQRHPAVLEVLKIYKEV